MNTPSDAAPQQHVVHIPLPLPRQIQELQQQEEEEDEGEDSASDFEDALEEEREEDEEEDDDEDETGDRNLVAVPPSRRRFLDSGSANQLRGRGRGGRGGGGRGRGIIAPNSSNSSSGLVPRPPFPHRGSSARLLTKNGRGMSVEMLEPDFHDLSRKSSLSVAVVNVIATVVGKEREREGRGGRGREGG